MSERPRSRAVTRYVPHFEGPGRPTQLGRMIELAKMSWSPILEMLGREVRFEEMASRPYVFPNPPMALPTPRNGATVRNWLQRDDVIRIHDEMIATFRGEPGIRDLGMIEGTLDRMQNSNVMGHDPYPTIFEKAAFLMHSILRYHPFIDGQKRTGLSAAFIFLGINGYYLWSRDAVDEVHFAIQVAQGKFEVPAVTNWIKQRVAAREYIQDPRIIEGMLRSSSEVPRRNCTACRKSLRLNRYIVRCSKCGTVFEVRLNAGLIRPGIAGSRTPLIQVLPALRSVGPERVASRSSARTGAAGPSPG